MAIFPLLATFQNWVLVVEDHVDTREALVEVLNGAGFAALGAAGVADALKTLADKPPPALVLADVILGGENGGELLDQAAKIFGPDMPPFVFVTGMTRSHVTGLPATARVLKKPLSINALLEVVGSYCGRAEHTPGPGPL